MRAVSIQINYPPKFVQTAEDRDAIRIGQRLTGHVQLDAPGRPRRIEILWRDARGRLLGRTAGDFEAYNRRVRFAFEITQSPFWLHAITCIIDGREQAAHASFIVSPATQGWETMPAITWATYPDGDFHDRLQEVGVNGEIAFKMNHFEHVSANGMRFYVDNSTPDEIACYHRPHRLFWEPPAEAKPPYLPWGRGFRDNWRLIKDRYLRVRARAKREGCLISRDPHFRKVLVRDFCPNNPATVAEASERLAGVVRLHKAFRPLFYNMADEAGIGDQCKPFDFCYCPWCMDKFRKQLEQTYQTLDRLNDEWGASFTTWDEVYPLTIDETMDAQPRGRPLNFASWNDHRAFMDDTFVNFFRQVREEGKRWDPIGDFSQGGCQAPAAYGGWDYAKVVRHIDALIPYNIGGNQEAVRSFGHGVHNLSPFFGDDPRLVRALWHAFIHGDAGVVFWDADEEKGRFVQRPGGRLSKRGRLFGPALREIRGGMARQFNAWTRRDDAIGLLYSQPSLRTHWILEALDRRGQSEWFDCDSDDGRYQGVRLSWQELIEDRQRQYRYVSYLAVDEGTEDLNRYRLLILPETLAISDTLATALRDFVERGGVLVVDGRCGRFNGHGRQAVAGVLDDLFGVRHGPRVTLTAGAALRGCRQAWLDLGPAARELRALDRDLRLAPGLQAEVAARAGGAPALIRRRVGLGWAVWLNTDLSLYRGERFRMDGAAPRACRRIMDALLDLAALAPAVTVRDESGADTVGIEVVRFTQNRAELVTCLGNRGIRISGVGDRSDPAVLNAFECDRRVELAFPDKAHTWNARTGAYLGHTDRIHQKLPQLTPLIVSRLPYHVRGLTLQTAPRAAQGARVTLNLALRSDADRPVDHVLRVDVYNPDGVWCHWYGATVTACGGAASHAFTLALDDSPGAWRIEARDAVTGATATRSLRVVRCSRPNPQR